jgi:mRNA (guanine-N7-)-methyltransferase
MNSLKRFNSPVRISSSSPQILKSFSNKSDCMKHLKPPVVEEAKRLGILLRDDCRKNKTKDKLCDEIKEKCSPLRISSRKCSPVRISSRKCSPVRISSRKCSPVRISSRKCSPVRISSRKCSPQILKSFSNKPDCLKNLKPPIVKKARRLGISLKDCGKNKTKDQLCDEIENKIDKDEDVFKKINRKHIADHYDKIVLNQDLYTVEKDRTKNLRRINNFIKAGILMNYVNKNNVVLDLGCGKGGDLRKYKSLKIKKYVGVDVSEKSIQEAISRVRYLKPSFVAQFCVNDAYNDKLLFAGAPNQFDVITSQFSFHYAFFDETSLETSVFNINTNLKPGGFFIITVPRKNVIINRVLKHRAHNSLYSITDVNPKSNDIDSWKNYNFSLCGSINKCTEYFVNFLKLKEMLEKEKIYLEERTPFVCLLKQYIRKHENLFTQMKINNPNAEEKEIIGLYEVIVFRKSNFKRS